MSLVHSYQSKMLICKKSFAFFIEGKQYYCMYDNGEHFYIWCGDDKIPVNQIKLGKHCRDYFILS